MEYAIEAKSLAKKFGGLTTVNGVSLSIRKGSAKVLFFIAFMRNLYLLFTKKNSPRQVKTEKFVGVIKEMRMDCYLTGYCVILLEPNISILAGYNPGDVSPEILEAQEGIWGGLIGFEVGKEKEYIGRKVEIYAEDKGVSKHHNYHHYTIEGDKNYYVKLLP